MANKVMNTIYLKRFICFLKENDNIYIYAISIIKNILKK